MWGTLIVLLLVVLVFAVIRVVTDVPNVAAGTVPATSSFEHRYATYPWLAYAHIGPGLVYLLLAPIQLWRGFRTRHLRWHRRIGRVAIVAGLLSGVFGITFGFFLSFGGMLEASAAVVFGTWFAVALVVAYRSVRRGDVRRHRRWMIRAFAVGLAVGTIRIWVGLFQAFGLLDFRESFGVAFWLSFAMHVAFAELWVRLRPWPGERPTRPAAVAVPRGAEAPSP